MCIWIPLIFLKIENNKKIIYGYCSPQKMLFICLNTLFMRGVGKKKKKKKNANSLDADANPNGA